jgi:hypothetical protein
MYTHRPPVSGGGLVSKVAAASLTGVLVATLAGLGVSPAQSAMGPACPEPFPVEALARDQAVTGLTVSEGTLPDAFTGEVIGVLKDGIMPGLDMIMVRLSSPEIDRVGIWSGMSGSPVYAADGRLIGAVAYGLALGASPVAGLTPASEMLELLSADATSPAGPGAEQVAIPRRLGKRLVASGVASSAEVEEGLAQLEVPLTLAGVSDPKRYRSIARRIGADQVRIMRAGSARAEAEPIPVSAGGNLAASVSFGDITLAGVGTATVECDDEVVGFGHPMDFSGSTTLGLHGAEALYIQEDLIAGFKVANIGAPIGTIFEDRMAGIAGSAGELPDTADVTTTVTRGDRSRRGTTQVTLPDWFSDVTSFHVFANMDRIFDAIGEGSSSVTWTASGMREDGTPFEVHRSDIYGDPFDITGATAFDVYFLLSSLQFNDIEDVTIDAFDADIDMTPSYEHASIQRVSLRKGGAWVPLKRRNAIELRAGRTARLRVELRGTDAAPTQVRVEVPVKRSSLGNRGRLSVFGGNTGFFDEFSFGRAAAARA